ncbi:hypothetical protein F5X96DRAFT_351528 [Biscogniauxia mediterranea]|nr:hypothetical protein F5X96DRAFT_351528 [Biscogniauxia mediterranea]
MTNTRSPGRELGLPTSGIGELGNPRYRLRSSRPSTRSSADGETQCLEDDIILRPPKRTRISFDGFSPESLQEEIQSIRPRITPHNAPIYGSSAGLPHISPAQGSRESTLVTERTRVASVYDGGYQLEQDYLQERLENDSDIEITDSSPFATENEESLEDELHDVLVESVFLPGEPEFLPGDELRRLVCPRRVNQLFADDQLRIQLPSDHDSIGSLICPPLGSISPSYQRILTILILLGNNMFKQIGHFIMENVDDTHLPLKIVRSTEHRTEALARSSEDETVLEFSLGWRRRYLKEFIRWQWQVSPTFFAVRNEDIAHYECRKGEILPFMAVKQGQELPFWGHDRTFDPADTSRAGNSVMFKYQIHEGQQNLRRYTTDGPSRAIAVKKLQSTVREDFQKERRMLVRLTPHTTLHLSKLLATFETPYTSGDMPFRNYYLIFEWADMSLRDLWNRGHPTTIEQHVLSQWVAQQCRGLAEALDIIHEFKAHRRRSDIEPRTHGFHGDIKPENILWYSNWKGCDYPFGVLQITDFGLSSFHNTATALDIKARMLDHTYSPPESILARRISQSLDIWTLGCLFLEFAAWLGNGIRGVDDFEEARMTKQSLTGWEAATFYTVEQVQGQTSVAINEEVINWVEKMCRGRRCSQFICDFVQVVLNQMILVENGQIEDADDSGFFGSPSSKPSMSKRISAGELASRLSEIVKMGKTQEDYHVRRLSKPPNLRLHHHRRLKIVINESRESVKEEVRRKKRDCKHGNE